MLPTLAAKMNDDLRTVRFEKPFNIGVASEVIFLAARHANIRAAASLSVFQQRESLETQRRR